MKVEPGHILLLENDILVYGDKFTPTFVSDSNWGNIGIGTVNKKVKEYPGFIFERKIEIPLGYRILDNEYIISEGDMYSNNPICDWCKCITSVGSTVSDAFNKDRKTKAVVITKLATVDKCSSEELLKKYKELQRKYNSLLSQYLDRLESQEAYVRKTRKHVAKFKKEELYL